MIFDYKGDDGNHRYEADYLGHGFCLATRGSVWLINCRVRFRDGKPWATERLFAATNMSLV